MKILENLLLDRQEEIESSKLGWICNEDPCNLQEIDLDTMETATYEIFNPSDYFDIYTCMCSLPGNKIFCYRGQAWSNNIKGIAFIIDENHKVKRLPSEISTVGYCATFYNNFIYMFGESCLFRYNLVKNRWENLIKTSDWIIFCTCIPFNTNILVACYDSAYAFIFDIWSLSFSLCSLELEQDSIKSLCKYKDVAYLIDFSGLIWESNKNNLYWWNIVGSCQSLHFMNPSVKVFYKNTWYFSMDSEIFKFSLDSKTVERTKASIYDEYS